MLQDKYELLGVSNTVFISTMMADLSVPTMSWLKKKSDLVSVIGWLNCDYLTEK